MATSSLEIAHIVADGRPGGGTTMVLGLIDSLLAAGGYQVTLVSQPGSYLAHQAQQRGLPFVGLDFFTSMIDVRLPWRLARRLSKQTFHVSHLHGLRAAHHAVRWPARPRLGRLIYTVHGLHQLHQQPVVRWLANHAERQVMRRVDARVFVSHADAQTARNWRLLGADADSEVIHNGSPVDRLEALQRPQRDIDVVFIARHVEPKGPQAAARVLAALAARGWHCVMAGDGPLRAECQALLRAAPGGDRVQSLGELQHADALALLSRSRVCVMPSLWEGLPILPIEAMALGVPVVASRLPGMAEVVDDGSTGLLTTPGDEGAMTQAVQALLTDPARLQCLQAAGHARARQHFDSAACAMRYRALYEPARPRS